MTISPFTVRGVDFSPDPAYPPDAEFELVFMGYYNGARFTVEKFASVAGYVAKSFHASGTGKTPERAVEALFVAQEKKAQRLQAITPK